jgi:hypothetical protein
MRRIDPAAMMLVSRSNKARQPVEDAFEKRPSCWPVAVKFMNCVVVLGAQHAGIKVSQEVGM